ncbi:MAG: AraC family transcriptional regulator [Bacteroidia bacterium]
MSVPFAAMGAVPKEGMGLKIDFCVDDADSLVNLKTWPDSVHLPLFFCSNWEGYLDFSFPDHWRHFRLVGGPSPMRRIGNLVGQNWVIVILALVSIAGIVIYVQARRIAELKDVMPRRTMNPGVVEGIMAEPSAETQAAMVANEARLPEPDDASEPEEIEQNAVQRLQGAKHPVVARCRQVVLDRLDQDLKMEELASECAVSLRQLQRIFKDEMGMGPGSFVVIIKMERAAELLRSGQCNVSEAAWALGFQDGSYFSRVFKKYHGVSPKSFMAA